MQCLFTYSTDKLFALKIELISSVSHISDSGSVSLTADHLDTNTITERKTHERLTKRATCIVCCVYTLYLVLCEKQKIESAIHIHALDAR